MLLHPNILRPLVVATAFANAHTPAYSPRHDLRVAVPPPSSSALALYSCTSTPAAKLRLWRLTALRDGAAQ
eukprot:1442784-Prorocentrum_lima.AAC.1